MKTDKKQKYKAMFNGVKELINDWDPYSLIEGGSPTDEFEPEISKILAGVTKCTSAEETTKLISTIFGESFEKDLFSIESCKDIGNKVYFWYKNFKI